MRRLVLALLGLVLVNVVLGVAGRSIAREEERLRERLSGLTRDADEALVVSEKRQQLEELVTLAERGSPAGPLDIGPLRDILFGAEQGLPIARLSLDFRPEQRLPDGFGGSTIHASLRGSLEALFGYLERIEAMHLPLAPETLTLREDGASIHLTVRWSARWPLTVQGTPPALTTEEIVRLTGWLKRGRPPNMGRDLFSLRVVADQARALARAPREALVLHAGQEPDTDERAESDLRPELAGFVLARPELESDVSRRVLAAVRYEGGMQLVKVGDVVGGYVVERIDARESVTLAHSGTGERVVLSLE